MKPSQFIIKQYRWQACSLKIAEERDRLFLLPEMERVWLIMVQIGAEVPA